MIAGGEGGGGGAVATDGFPGRGRDDERVGRRDERWRGNVRWLKRFFFVLAGAV